jgi:methyltransferase (TIGR00027 family)
VPERIVSHISDTARWVAVYRAMESERADALFQDPFAARLAGDRGREIASLAPRPMRRHVWPMVMRTKAIDDFVMAEVTAGADRVLNLAAGLDTRPYRLPLPPSLTWTEADLPDLLDEKERLLAGETPRCRLVRERVDLSDAAARGAFLERALDGAVRAVVVTEGLLIYLSNEGVGDIARALSSRASVRAWIVDLVSPAILGMLRRQVGASFSADAQFRFAPENGVAFFEPLGWKATSVRPMLRDAYRARRLPLLLRPFALFPDPDPSNVGKRPWSAVVKLEPNGQAGRND